MATAEDGSFKPLIRQSKLALTSRAAMAGYIYACEFCEMRFQSMKYAKEHQIKCKEKLAKEDNPESEIIVCEFCRRQFTSAAFAKSHMRYCERNSMNQVAKCLYCNIEVKIESLDAHQKSCYARFEDGIYICSYCGHKSENSMESRAHAKNCRVYEALSYAPKQVLHKCKACSKLFQGKLNFIKHASACSMLKRERAKTVAPPVSTMLRKRHMVDDAEQPEPSESAGQTTEALATTNPAKRPHTIKQNPDGSMVIVLGERDGAKNQGQGDCGQVVMNPRVTGKEGRGKSSIIIDLRGRKLLTDNNDENVGGSGKNDGPQHRIRPGSSSASKANKLPTKSPIVSPIIAATSSTHPVAVTPPAPVIIAPSDDSAPQETVYLYSCPYCKIDYDDRVTLATHMQTCYIGDNRYPLNCSHCDDEFDDLQASKAHEKQCALGKKATQILSANCGPSSVWNEPLTVVEPPQMTVVDPPQMTVVEPPQMTVAEPTETSSEKEDPPAGTAAAIPAASNPTKQPSKVPEAKNSTPAALQKSTPTTKFKERAFACDYCKVPYENHHLMLRHMKTCYLGDQRYSLECSFCNLEFADLRARVKHEKSYHQKSKNKKSSSFVASDLTPGEGVQERVVMDSESPEIVEGMSAGQSQQSSLLEEEGEVSEDYQQPPRLKVTERVLPVQFALPRYTCDLCGMEGFQNKSSLHTHQTFCTWVTQQQVKLIPEKKMGTGLSISANTSDALFSEVSEKEKLASSSLVAKRNFDDEDDAPETTTAENT